MSKKSAEAFRTIREVADWLEVPTHVLRFWESKFKHVKPVKGAGGRRYYRKDDMLLLGGIKELLHVRGLTIRGAQKMLDEEGLDPTMALSPELPSDAPRKPKIIRSEPEPQKDEIYQGNAGGIYALETPITADEAPMVEDVEPQEPEPNVIALNDTSDKEPEAPSDPAPEDPLIQAFEADIGAPIPRPDPTPIAPAPKEMAVTPAEQERVTIDQISQYLSAGDRPPLNAAAKARTSVLSRRLKGLAARMKAEQEL